MAAARRGLPQYSPDWRGDYRRSHEEIMARNPLEEAPVRLRPTRPVVEHYHAGESPAALHQLACGQAPSRALRRYGFVEHVTGARGARITLPWPPAPDADLDRFLAVLDQHQAQHVEAHRRGLRECGRCGVARRMGELARLFT